MGPMQRGGPVGTQGGFPVKGRAESAFRAPGLRVGARVGGSAGEAGSLSRTPAGRAWRGFRETAQESRQSAPATRVCCLGGSHLFPASPPAARGSVSPRTGAHLGGSAACSTRGSPGKPPPHPQRASPRPQGSRGIGRRGRREGGKEGSERSGRQERLPDARWGASVPRAGLWGWRVGASPPVSRVWKEVRLCRKRAGEGQLAGPPSFAPLPWGLGASLRTLYLLARGCGRGSLPTWRSPPSHGKETEMGSLPRL